MEHLDLSQLGFVVSALKTEGRPAFELKLFLRSICIDISMRFEVVGDWKKNTFETWNCNVVTTTPT